MTAHTLRAGAILTVDLDAVVSNWRLLSKMTKPAECAAVVKADAYGLGAAEVGAALLAAGCKTFFVAHLGEGLDLRRAIGFNSRIFVLNGTPPGTEGEFLKSVLMPVVNTVGELAAWRTLATEAGRSMPVALQLDTGMSRLGLSPGDVAVLAGEPALLAGLSVELIMSHLACADEAVNPANHRQRRELAKLRAVLPKKAQTSLANSSGIFIEQGFHFDLVRPGAALYGINPAPGQANPMRQVAALSARVLQLRDVPAGSYVGYGHAFCSKRRSRLATVSLGYADGWPRAASMSAFFNGEVLPFAGRVSMDVIVVDATGCANPPREGDLVDLICQQQSVDDIARAAGTIGYEILTRLGRRFHREYRHSATPPASATALREAQMGKR
ncbi:alanine racemase [Nitratireductor mangrovi]|uniref:Alanine racemase n=1 Tax=Nitratireductor mangrovi TaxID=2599600 RepID=A0A5B8KX18_9HYPH|nr:alanine racemase [Nitratireductor mangrovi]QDZ00224.1 alanine racemase [Nitratireductor mangrovi]